MNNKAVVSGICGALLVLPVMADDAADLLALDKAWGQATTPQAIEALLSNDMVSIGAEGLGGKAQLLEDVAAASGPYDAGDYQTHFLSDDIAVMVHSTSGEDPHWSMHVWQRVGGRWQVAATASVPRAE